MVSVLIFNRKRVGDVQNILVKEFERRQIIAENCESLPEETEKLIKSRIPITYLLPLQGLARHPRYAISARLLTDFLARLLTRELLEIK